MPLSSVIQNSKGERSGQVPPAQSTCGIAVARVGPRGKLATRQRWRRDNTVDRGMNFMPGVSEQLCEDG